MSKCALRRFRKVIAPWRFILTVMSRNVVLVPTKSSSKTSTKTTAHTGFVVFLRLLVVANSYSELESLLHASNLPLEVEEAPCSFFVPTVTLDDERLFVFLTCIVALPVIFDHVENT